MNYDPTFPEDSDDRGDSLRDFESSIDDQINGPDDNSSDDSGDENSTDDSNDGG